MRIPVRTALALVILSLVTACGGADTDTGARETIVAAADPSRPPAEVRWEPWEGVALPVSAVDGPKTVLGAALGYTRTPQGAVLAAMQHSIRLSLASDGVWPKVASQALVSSAGKDTWVLARGRISITGPANPALAPAIIGYRITTYTPERVAVDIYTRYPDNSLAAHHQVVEWVTGDWRLRLPDPSAKTPTIQEISTLPAETVRFEATR